MYALTGSVLRSHAATAVVCASLAVCMLPLPALSGGSVDWEGDVSSDWNDADNWENNTFPLSTETATIDPSSYTNPPVVSASAIPFFTPDKIEVVNGGVLTIQADLNVNDKMTVDGNNTTAPVVNMSGGTLTILNNKNLEIKGGGVFNLTGGAVLVTKDLVIEEGTFNMDESDGASSVTTDSESNGQGKLKIKCKGDASALFNMDAGSVTIGESLELDGNQELGARTATLDISGGAFTNNGATGIKKNEADETPINVSGGTVTLAGNVSDSPNGVIHITLSGGTLVMQGNLSMEAGDLITHSGGDMRFEGGSKTWDNAGRLTSTGGTIEFQGSRTLSGTGTYTFYNAKVNSAEATALTLSLNASIGNLLTMASGDIDITGYELELGVSDAAPGSLAHTNGAIFGGSFKRWFGAGPVSGDDGLFPVGLSGEYRPVLITSTTDIAAGGAITASHTDAGSATDVGIDDGGTTIERVHDMASNLTLAGGISGGVFDVEVTMTNLAATGSTGDIRLTKDGGVVGAHAATTGTVDNPTAMRTGVATADLEGSWKVGTTDKSTTPLPILLMDFTASLVDNTAVVLTWITASEINNDFFTVERSTNGLTFYPVANVPGSGTTNRPVNYETYDDAPVEGVSYYRLKQTDFDGRFEYFKVVAVNLERSPDGSCVLKVFPNPCIGQCTVDLSGCKHNETAAIKVDMIDAAGNLVYSHVPYRDFEGSFQFNIDAGNNLKPGVYIVRGTSESESYHSKIIIK